MMHEVTFEWCTYGCVVREGPRYSTLALIDTETTVGVFSYPHRCPHLCGSRSMSDWPPSRLSALDRLMACLNRFLRSTGSGHIS